MAVSGERDSADGQARRELVRSLHDQYVKGKTINVGNLTPSETYQALFGETVELPDLHPFGKALHNAIEHIPHPHPHLRHPS